MPYVSRNGLHVDKPEIIERDEKSEWAPYIDDPEPENTLHQRSNVRSVCRGLCDLSEIVHQTLYVLYAPGPAITCPDVLEIYSRYLNWYDSLPRVLRMGENSTPAVLFAQ